MQNVLKNPTPKKRYVPKVRFTEDAIQRRVCTYLRTQYPNIIFRSDLDSGRNKESHFHRSRMAAMNSSRSWPDLFIYEPRTINGKHYCGLAIEIKREGTIIVLKTGPRKGHITSNPHIREQTALLKSLIKKGYYADFGVGFDNIVDLIDWYMEKPKNLSIF